MARAHGKPYFQAPGDEKRINITDREFTIVDLIKKYPDFIEEFGSEPGRADALRQVRPSTDDTVSDLQNELLRSLRKRSVSRSKHGLTVTS